jgi:hypothetical protein
MGSVRVNSAQRRRWYLAGVALWVCLGPPTAGAAASEAFAPDRTLCLRLSIEATRPAIDPVAIRHEVAAIWQANGVRVIYADRATRSCAPPADRAVLVLVVDGPSALPARLRSGLSRSALGATVSHDGVPSNLAMAFADRAATAARRSVTCAPGPGACMSRLLARVIAHELGHILLGTGAHASTGLMRATFTASDLALNRPEAYLLTAPERDLVLAQLDAGGVQGRGDAAITTP